AGWSYISRQCLPTPTMGDDTFSHGQHSLTDALQQRPWKNKFQVTNEQYYPEAVEEESLPLDLTSPKTSTTDRSSTE
ncbi:hypothetical protein JOQ06_024210, partial [Pogonophryne albipinna]